METTSTPTVHATITHGTPPTGRANGSERWATITHDDSLTIVTAYIGWGISDEVTLHGPAARTLAEQIVRDLIGVR